MVRVQDGATWFMVGLIWLVQVVHYPMFAAVERGSFRGWHALHTRRITWIVMGPMLAELVASVLLVQRRGGYVGVALVALIWGVTMGVMIPLHDRLQAGGFDARLHASLVRWNWVRTVAWTLRGLIVVLA